MAAPNTAPDDFAVPYDAPRQQSMVAMAQPNAPKKDCSKHWLAFLSLVEAAQDCEPLKTTGDNEQRILGWKSG